MSYSSVVAHRRMALDARRNAAYGAALRQAIGPATVVLDLGAGTGIHGLMAAQLGAKRVYLVETEDIIAVAGEIVRANGLQDRVRCMQGRLEDLEVPEPVDVIVSVLTGNFLLTEDLLPTLFHARDTLLKPGGLLIPGAATMEAAPISAPDAHATEIASWSRPQHGVDMSPARAYAANTVFYRPEGLREADYLAEPLTLHTLDFHHDDYTSVHRQVTYTITQSGTCHGWLGWFTMQLGDKWLSTSPREDPLHWSPAFFPVDPPLVFARGEHVSFTLDRPPFGDWTWRVESAAGTQRHSTLLSAPMTAATLKKAPLNYQPSLSPVGCALVDVLSSCDGVHSVDTIARALHDRYSKHYHSYAEALSFVQEIVKRYT